MKIYIREKDGKEIKIPIPMWLLKLGTSEKVLNFIKKRSNDESKEKMGKVDLSIIGYFLDDLNRYKGLEVVHVEEKDGTMVKIVI